MSESTTMTADASPTSTDALREHPIIFFDGECGLCNSSVDTFMRWDTRGVLRYAPLQGETAGGVVDATDREHMNSLLLVTEHGTYRRSAAVARILWRIGGWSSVLGTLLWLIPLPLRDLGYWIVAKNRYRWFGKRDLCRVPTPEEYGRILP